MQDGINYDPIDKYINRAKMYVTAMAVENVVYYVRIRA